MRKSEDRYALHEVCYLGPSVEEENFHLSRSVDESDISLDLVYPSRKFLSLMFEKLGSPDHRPTRPQIFFAHDLGDGKEVADVEVRLEGDKVAAWVEVDVGNLSVGILLDPLAKSRGQRALARSRGAEHDQIEWAHQLNSFIMYGPSRP